MLNVKLLPTNNRKINWNTPKTYQSTTMPIDAKEALSEMAQGTPWRPGPLCGAIIEAYLRGDLVPRPGVGSQRNNTDE